MSRRGLCSSQASYGSYRTVTELMLAAAGAGKQRNNEKCRAQAPQKGSSPFAPANGDDGVKSQIFGNSGSEIFDLVGWPILLYRLNTVVSTGLGFVHFTVANNLVVLGLEIEVKLTVCGFF